MFLIFSHTKFTAVTCFCASCRPYALLALFFEIFTHPKFQRRNKEAELFLRHIAYVRFLVHKNANSERIVLDLDLFQLCHLLFVEFLSEKQQQTFIFLSDIL